MKQRIERVHGSIGFRRCDSCHLMKSSRVLMTREYGTGTRPRCRRFDPATCRVDKLYEIGSEFREELQ